MAEKLTEDSFTNFLAKLGLGTQNLQSYASYTQFPQLSRDRQTLEFAYRSSWIVGQVVDTVAEDMTREGISISTSVSPDDVKKIQSAMTRFKIMPSLSDTIRWARLYGGAIAVILTEGADYSKPLNLEAISKNRFKGLLVLDRWMIDPDFTELVTEIGIDMGMPKYYTVLSGMPVMAGQKIHYSRVVRFDGIILPYQQKLAENLWGLSVVERMYDRLLAYDSATAGASQLLHKAHLRTIKVDGFRDALAMGGKTEGAIIKQFNYIRLLQTMEGLTVLDAKDEFQTHTYSFSGIHELLIQFGQQISGATGIPLVRLFGQSPAGLSATGESDLRNYYDHINKLQENQMRMPVQRILELLFRSELGISIPDDLEFDFNPLWQLSSMEKVQVASAGVSAVSSAFTTGMITKKIAMKELTENSRITGVFTNITDEDIEKAKDEPPMMGGMPPMGGVPEGSEDESLGGLRDALNDIDNLDESGLKDLRNRLKSLLSESDQEIQSLKERLKKITETPAEVTLRELRKRLKGIDNPLGYSSKDGFVSSIIKPLIGLGIVMKLFGGEKKLTAKERVDRMMGKDFGRNLIEDEQLRAPKGGVTIKGKYFSGGQFIPSKGGYAEEYKKIQRRREGETAKEQEGGEEKNSSIKVNNLEGKRRNIVDKYKKSTPQKNKDDVATKISKKMGVSYDEVNQLVGYWAETSADRSPDSLGLQYVVKEIFGAGEIDHFDSSVEPNEGYIKGEFVEAVYEETQEWFKQQGYEPDDKILLYRGVKDKIEKGSYSLQPLSSFSFSRETADYFAGEVGTVFFIEVPVKDIFSTPFTGPGCTGEYEVIVIGRDIDINVVEKVSVDDLDDLKTVGEYDDIIVGKIPSLKGFPEKINGSLIIKMSNLTSLEGAPKYVGGDFQCTHCPLKSLDGFPEYVGGGVNLTATDITSLEGLPQKVEGTFCCDKTKITSLVGAPKEVMEFRSCDIDTPTSLEGAPDIVTGNFHLRNNVNLISLKGLPEEIGGDFHCIKCGGITSLEGMPKKVGGSFIFTNMDNITSLEGIPKSIGRSFTCCNNPKLTSLKGCPEITGDIFDCSKNENLKSLEGVPKTMVNFDCSNNGSLTSLRGGPEHVSGSYYCSDNKNITSLEGAPKMVGRSFDCHGNEKLTSLKGAPEFVGGNFFCNGTAITSLVGCPKEVRGDFVCDSVFTEEEIRSVCNVKGSVIIMS